MRLIIGSDHFGFPLKAALREHLAGLGHSYEDVGCESAQEVTDYPDVAVRLADRIASGEFARGILVCGTGIGMAMVANKVPGVRAACCHDPYSAARARKSNDAQIITFGSQVVGVKLACALVDEWLRSEFSGARSLRKVEKIRSLDARLAAGLRAIEDPATVNRSLEDSNE